MLFHEELFTRSQCNCCQQEISGLGVECLDCTNLKLCCECFAVGAEVGQHKVDHTHRFFDSGSLVLSLKPIPKSGNPQGSLQGPKWSAREEIRLLDAIEQYGFGNWQDISRHIETKTSAEAKSEYVNRYVEGALGKLTWTGDIPNEVTRNIINLQKPIDHTLPCDDGPLSPSLTQRLPPLDISADEMLQLGYMPNRDDYEKEYDNEAEKLVAQLSFTSEDEDIDVGLKLALVDMYARRLRERARRKRMIRDYQIVAKFFKKEKNKLSSLCEINGTKEVLKGQFAIIEKSLNDKLKPFIQFFNNREYEYFVINMIKELELKYRMRELFKYRRHGIRRPEECCDFERSRGTLCFVRGKRNLETILESSENMLEGRSGNKKAKLEKFAAPLLVRQLQLAIPQNSPKSKSSTATNITGNDANVSENLSANRNLTPQPLCKEDSSLKSYTASKESGLALYPLEEPKATELMEVLTQTTNENSSQPKEKQKVLGDRFTVEYIPSSDLLTDAEFQLCLKLRITPAQFLTSKSALLLSRKPKIDNQPIEEREVALGCPPGILHDEWEQLGTFLKLNYC